MMLRSRARRLRILVVLAALVVSSLAGLAAPAHATSPEQIRASAACEATVSVRGWNWRAAAPCSPADDGVVAPLGWNWR